MMQIMNLSAEFESIQRENNYIGILNLDVQESNITKHKQHFVLTVDCSASMSDIVASDGKTKMQHILFTLENMLRFFSRIENGPSICVSIFAFDDTIRTIILNELITNDISQISNIIKLIQTNIFPMGSTNIELALTNASNYISTYMLANPNVVVSHLMMTDGEANCGSINNEKLKSYISELECSTIIFGFGTTHNSEMLSYITSDNDSLEKTYETAYYFIDQLENSGSVYGQALHKILYNSVSSVCISIRNGLIYNWKTGDWVSKLLVGNVGYPNKIFHVISKIPALFTAIANGICIETSELVNCYVSSIIFNRDLTKYNFRQQTLELLLESKRVKKNNYHECKLKLKNIFDEMTKYISENGLQEDVFMKLLCDDVYINYKTIGTKYGNMYANARQTSQGSQCIYNATYIPDDIVVEDMFQPKMLGNSLYFASFSGCNDDGDEEEVDDDDNKGAINASCGIYNDSSDSIGLLNIKPPELCKGYTFLDNTNTPYKNIKAISMMRSLTEGDSPRSTLPL
jgi:Mg-chelatase subunit ChlD